MVDKIFAPWRSEYILSGDVPDGCIFCNYPKQDKDAQNLIIHRGATCFVIMNRYPYSAGHLMVIPYRHLNDFTQLNDKEAAELMQTAQKAVAVLSKVMSPHGFNLGMNLGRVAGAGIDQHLHLHVVPRWNGDTNFMPVVGDTRVISEALESAYARIKEAWND